jgi:uncharacterized protein YkwD
MPRFPLTGLSSMGIPGCLILMISAGPEAVVSRTLIQNQVIDGEAIRDLKVMLVAQVNSDRTGSGLPPVEYLEELSKPADAHCGEMLKMNYVNHWNQAGQKPYMRYSLAGIPDHTAENIGSLWSSNFQLTHESLRKEIISLHQGFMGEKSPNDGHRRAILDPYHTHVGIGLAFDRTGIRMIEVFVNRYVALDPVPSRAKLTDRLLLRGRVLARGYKVQGITAYFEPPPVMQSLSDLRTPGSYGLPDEERVMRPRLPQNLHYDDGSQGTVELSGGRFTCPISFFRRSAGVYTFVVWIEQENQAKPAFMATNICIVVGDAHQSRE